MLRDGPQKRAKKKAREIMRGFGRTPAEKTLATLVRKMTDSLILVDLSQYLVADKPPRSDLSLHVNFATDEGAFRFVFYVDGQPGWTAPITPASGGATQSPIVTLATRA